MVNLLVIHNIYMHRYSTIILRKTMQQNGLCHFACVFSYDDTMSTFYNCMKCIRFFISTQIFLYVGVNNCDIN